MSVTGLEAAAGVRGVDAAGPAERATDLAMRLALGGFFGYLAAGDAGNLGAWARATDFATVGPAVVIQALPNLGMTLFCLVVAATAITRRRRIAAAPGLYPRLVAFTGTFFLMLIGWLPPVRSPSLAISLASSLCMLVGSLLGAVVAYRLGRSFSIMPEARKLVTDGPYRVVRHPLYVVEEIVTIGVLMRLALPWSVLLLIAHVALQLERMRLEEQVLRRSFPDYAAYAKRTARLLPGIY